MFHAATLERERLKIKSNALLRCGKDISFQDFFWKRETLLISSGYIKVIQRLETLPTSAKWHTALKHFGTQTNTLISVNPKTRPSSMCPGKNILGHLLQEPRGRNKRPLRSRLLKGSPSAQSVRSLVEYLQKRGMFVFEYRSVSAEPDKPA